MAARIGAFDWDRSALGPRRMWPASLELMLGIALKSSFPMLVLWGPDFIQTYNDAFVPILGARHPGGLGQSARACWPEIWDTIGPMIEKAFTSGEPVSGEDLPLTLERNGYPEQTYFTFSYSQFGVAGEPGGVLCTCVETTQAMLREAEFRMLAEQRERDFDREHRALVAFQAAALPASLVTVPGLDFDAIYEAAGADALVGGDWYDAFRLADGRVVFSVGDVSGSGLGAAVTMAAVRQTIRGAVQVYPDPAAVLDAADRALRSEQPDRIVTAFLGIFDPLTRGLAYASAGHPPPLLRHQEGSIAELDARGLPLGLRNELQTGVTATVTLPENSLLVLYTDGLTESTRDFAEGEQRLRDVLERDEIVADRAPAAAIRRAVLGAASDDVAILTIKIGSSSERVTRWSFSCADASISTRVRRELAAVLRDAHATVAEVADAELVFGELLGNVVRHTSGAVEAALDLTATEPVLHVLDRGPGFILHSRLPKDSMSESGRGLFIAKELSKEVSVVLRPDGGSHARVVLAVRPKPARV